MPHKSSSRLKKLPPGIYAAPWGWREITTTGYVIDKRCEWHAMTHALQVEEWLAGRKLFSLSSAQAAHAESSQS